MEEGCHINLCGCRFYDYRVVILVRIKVRYKRRGISGSIFIRYLDVVKNEILVRLGERRYIRHRLQSYARLGSVDNYKVSLLAALRVGNSYIYNVVASVKRDFREVSGRNRCVVYSEQVCAVALKRASYPYL